MKLHLYNTLSRKKEIFEALDKECVKMYVCGPTVYDNPHIGNARSIVVYDLLYRLLIEIFGKSKVKYVRNITDVDDKIIDKAQKLNTTIQELTENITHEFHKDMEYLNCLAPTLEPKATQHIKQMIQIIQKLIQLGHAYVAENHVYFDVSSAKDYTELSNRSLDSLNDGVRIENSKAKKNPHDFVLWKPAKENEPLAANFVSPWGLGRPGWHIECSSMSYEYLGKNFDIHGGGVDLIFPHHTNEIAQSKCAFPGSYYAKYWVHNGFLTVNSEKMSKSLGNYITVKNLIDQKISGEIIRLFLLSTHYRKPLDYNDKAIEDAKKTLDYWYRAIENINLNTTMSASEDFLAALLDDMNTPLAIKIMNDYAKAVFSSTDKEEKQNNAAHLLAAANFIGLIKVTAKEWFKGIMDESTIKQLINSRLEAKKQKNWLLADQIRTKLLEKGVILEDNPNGITIWRKSK